MNGKVYVTRKMNDKIYVTRFGQYYNVEEFETDCDAIVYAKRRSLRDLNVLYMVRVLNYVNSHSRFFFYMNGHFIGDNDCPLISEEDLYRFKI